MHIDAYHFGSIVIDGVTYDDDVLVTQRGVRKGWWRKAGHDVALFDLAEALDPPPSRIIIGTGAHGQCRVLSDIGAYCKRHGIELVIVPTPEAVVEFNALADQSTTVAALHLTG